MSPHVSATWGDANAHLTLSAGAVAFFPGQSRPWPRFVIAGDLRLFPHVAAITENWFFVAVPGPGSSGRPLFSSLGLRLFGKSFAVDLGGVLLVWIWNSRPSGALPVPWLAVTCNFN